MSDERPGSSPGGLQEALARLSAAAVALLRTRAEIAALDFDEAGKRAKERVALLVVGLLCVAVGILAATAFVIVCFWDTHRLAAVGVVTVAYLLAGALALWRFSVRQRTDPRPFGATIAELQRDVEWLSRKSGSGK
jgi:uncharacterized membrane protein YqjE